MPDELPLYKDYSQKCECFPGIQRILAFASLGREREARSSSKAKKLGGPPGENEFPGGECSSIKVTGAFVGKFREHP